VTVPADLAHLAAVHGVATSYKNQFEQPVQVAPDAVVAVLGALGVDASTPAAVREALEVVAHRPRQPPVVVFRAGEIRRIHVDGPAQVLLEDGARLDLDVTDGKAVLGPGLPVGWHLLRLGEDEIPVAVAPQHAPSPAGRHWGLTVQLYATRSAGSWGIGDLRDLATLARWTGEAGGDVVVVNPLHATGPVSPVQNSPYYPASRRWTNPIYLRVEDTAAYAAAPAEVRVAVDALRVPNNGRLIDRNRVWAAKLQALELLYATVSPLDVDRLDTGLRDWATWCALAERDGPDWRTWAPALRRPDGPDVAKARADLAERVGFHAWLQMLCAAELAAVQRQAAAAGLAIGVVHDLAVGTDPAGADAWAMQDALALGARIGAPPDSFNQQGQDWGMPPWHPRRLAEAGYAPLRNMLSGLLTHAGGVRIDHVLGLFRIWWVPEGASPRDGTYVSYDADALLGVVALEAARAGAVVIGEDLGTVTPVVRRELADRGLFGTTVLWFEREEPTGGRLGQFRPLDEWRAQAAASVTTHDLPTPLGWLRGEHVKVRAELGLLDDPAAEERIWVRERDEMIAFLRAAGLVDEGAEGDLDELAFALQAAIAATPSQVVLAAPGEAVGDLRQPNMPGTVDEYPNWRLPLADSTGREVPLEELLAHPRLRRLADLLARRIR